MYWIAGSTGVVGSAAAQAAVVLANSQAYWAAHHLSNQLEIALTSRAAIEQAKGILMATRGCTADEAFAEDPKCTLKGAPGTSLVLYDDTTRQMFVLDPQTPAVGHLGDSVTVSGTVDGGTLHVASFKMLTDIGLAVGQKAPDFAARDQFGQERSLATLKGTNGTVLLFFRSADW
jgi:hypothetical protein